MKYFILIIVISLSLIASVNAALIDNGDGTVTDTTTNLMWLKDANYANTSGVYFDYASDAEYWANQLIFAGYDDWRLPSAYNQDGSGPCRGLNCTDSELGNLFYNALGNGPNSGPGEFTNPGPFINVQTWIGYWSDTYYWESDCATPCVWIFSFDIGQLPVYDGTGGESAWAVRSISSGPVVPEPISSTLFIVGGATLGFRRYRRKR